MSDSSLRKAPLQRPDVAELVAAGLRVAAEERVRLVAEDKVAPGGAAEGRRAALQPRVRT